MALAALFVALVPVTSRAQDFTDKDTLRYVDAMHYRLINWAFDRCGHLRIDTHTDNKVMQAMALRLGFVPCGTIYVVQDNDPRIAYEKSERVHA